MGNLTFELNYLNYLPTNEDIDEIEVLIDAQLPSDYVAHMRLYNSLRTEELAFVFDAHYSNHQEKIIKCLGNTVECGIEDDHIFHPIIDDYKNLMHTSTLNYAISYNINRTPQQTIPIAKGFSGDVICMSIAPDNYGKIYNWLFSFQPEEGIHNIYDNMGFVANSFSEFLECLRSPDGQ